MKKREQFQSRRMAARMLNACCIVDIETTGFSRGKDALIEVGAIRIRDGQIAEERNWMINGVGQSTKAPRPAPVGEYTEAEVRAGQPWITVSQQVHKWMVGEPLVGWNCNRFDQPFLSAVCQRTGVSDWPSRMQWNDAMKIAKARWPHGAGYGLQTIYRLATHQSGDQWSQKHRALPDCRAVFEVMQKMAS